MGYRKAGSESRLVSVKADGRLLLFLDQVGILEA